MIYYVRCKDGQRWKVKEARSLQCALNCIAHARVTGSVGAKDSHTLAQAGVPMRLWPTYVTADVVQVNSDNSERRPYTESF